MGSKGGCWASEEVVKVMGIPVMKPVLVERGTRSSWRRF